VEWLLIRVPVVALPGLLVAGIWAAGLLQGQGAPRRGWRRRLLWGVPAGLALAGTLAVLIAVSPRTGRVAVSSGRGSYERVCGDCHSLTQPLHFVKTPAGWRRTVDRMQQMHGAPLDEGEADRVVGFLTAMRGISAETAFRTRCQRCHYGSASGWRERSPEEWEEIVERFARWSPFYYDAPIRALLVEHLSEHHGVEGGTLEMDRPAYDRYRIIGRRCAACHSISLQAERYRTAPDEETAELVRRMGAKVPGGIPDEEAARLAPAYQELLSDPGRLDLLFPHDRPVENPGRLRW